MCKFGFILSIDGSKCEKVKLENCIIAFEVQKTEYKDNKYVTETIQKCFACKKGYMINDNKCVKGNTVYGCEIAMRKS